MAVTAPRADLSSDCETTERPAPLPAFSLDSNRRACARRRFERPDQDQRADATPLHQPATRARLPDAAGALHDVREFLRAAHRHHATKLTELHRADASGEGRGGERTGILVTSAESGT
jgi:recombinational DNA repair protein (RecF pathway)